MSKARDERWMRTALTLARRGLGQVWPNPAVGCVIVKDGRLAGRGWTQPGGRPHAETVALAQAGDAAKGATVYVTLEPCSHHGKTPPCADALIGAGVERVVCALEDPDPHVSGNGFAKLRDAGIKLDLGLLNDEAVDVNRGFLLHRTLGRPMVTLKMAASLDGRIATKSGESRWITGEAARHAVHLMRAEHDAVLIGAGTALADDPMLDTRLSGMAGTSPVRVIADSGLSLSLNSRLAVTADKIPTWICHRKDIDGSRKKAWASTGAKLIAVDEDNGRMVPADLLTKLAEMGITRVLCEGGATLAASLISDGLVDRLVMFSAGLTIGMEGTPVIGALGVGPLSDAQRFELSHTHQVGDDVMSLWHPIAS